MSDVMAQTQSVFNPTDMARMKETGQVGQGTTIGQYLEGMGIKWEDTLDIAAQKMKGQVQNASPLGKAQNMAGPEGPPPAPAGSPGLDGLM